MRRAWLTWLAVPGWLLCASAAAGQERVALLIGNANYLQAPGLRNPRNDVRAMAQTLRDIGFDDVEIVDDLDLRAMGLALLAFQDKAGQADTALIFYSGHGMQIGDRNYLIPVDAEISRPGAERFEALPLEDVIEASRDARRLSVVILDACRNGAPGATRALIGRGFKPIENDRAALAIAFSTAPGEPAWDGDGDLSPYTTALTEALRARPDADIRKLFTSLGARTSALAGTRQSPYARFGELPADDVTLAGLEGSVDAVERALYRRATEQQSVELMQAFLSFYPNSSLREAAEDWIDGRRDADERARERSARAAWAELDGSRALADLERFLSEHGDSALRPEAEAAIAALKADHRDAQADLAALGLFTGAATEAWGADAKAALQAFQRGEGIAPADGAPTVASLEALDAAAKAASAERRAREQAEREAAEQRAAEALRRRRFEESAETAFAQIRDSREAAALRDFLGEYGQSAMAPAAEEALSALRAEQAEARKLLANIGYLEGDASGEWDREARRALQRFQREQGETADGVLRLASLGALRDESARHAADAERQAEAERRRAEEARVKAAWSAASGAREAGLIEAFLAEHGDSAFASDAEAALAALKQDYIDAQAALAELGHYAGAARPSWGAPQQAALSAFLAEGRLEPTGGVLTLASLDQLGAAVDALAEERRAREEAARRQRESEEAEAERQRRLEAAAAADWAEVKDAREVAAFDGFLAEHGDSALAEDASRAREALIADNREAQALLQAMGLYSSAIDGEWGRGSKRALLRFLTEAGMPAESDALTLASLGALRDETARREAERQRLEAEAAAARAAEQARIAALEPEAQAEWAKLRDSRDLGAIRDFIAAYGETTAGDAARALKDKLIGEFRAAQTELKRLGLYRSAIDGSWGPGSRAAMRAFQQQNGIRPADGEVTRASLNALKRAPTPEAAGVDEESVSGGQAAPDDANPVGRGASDWDGSWSGACYNTQITMDIMGSEFTADFISHASTGVINRGRLRGTVSATGVVDTPNPIIIQGNRARIIGRMPVVRMAPTSHSGASCRITLTRR